MNLGTSQAIRGNALNLPLADESVDLIVTSPPYFGLRSYQDGGEHYDGQIGAEATPAEFVDALIAATREMVRVTKPSGSIWVNLGDKYDSGTTAPRTNPGTIKDGTGQGYHLHSPRVSLGRPKSLIGIPWRYAIRCIDELGLILRAEVIWSKPNGLPESVTDRVRRSHEQWFHFTLEPRYFSAVDEVREPTNPANDAHAARYREAARTYGRAATDAHPRSDGNGNGIFTPNALGKLPGSVWTIPTEPLRVPDHLGVDHFAAFPTAFPKRIITGWSPRAVCSDCGFLLGSSYDSGLLGVRREFRASRSQRQGRGSLLLEGVLEPAHLAKQGEHEVPPTDNTGLRRSLEAGSPDGTEVGLPHGAPASDGRAPGSDAAALRGRTPQERDQDGQPDRESGTAREDRPRQAPEAGTQALRLPPLRRQDPDVRDALACPHCGGTSLDRPVVADVFGGTGTTALVAKALGRHGISVDMSSDYCRLAEWRTNDRDQLAKVLGVAKAEQQPDDQGDLLGLLDGEGIA